MIIVRLAGGLGNQMFQYALGRALALRHGVPLLLDLEPLQDRTPRPARQRFVFREYGLDLFAIVASVARRADVPFRHRLHGPGRLRLMVDALARRLLPHPGLERSYRFDPRVLALGPDAYLDGYWQSPRYFAGIEERLRNELTLKATLSPATARLRDEIAGHAALCVNVRRGDFVASAFHGVLDAEYYRAAVAHLRESVAIAHAYVFSDEPLWCAAHLRLPVPATVVGHEHAGDRFGEYLALMAACRHFVIPNSTFGFWAAWSGRHPDKQVVAPRRWFADPTIDTRDLVPEDWTRL